MNQLKKSLIKKLGILISLVILLAGCGTISTARYQGTDVAGNKIDATQYSIVRTYSVDSAGKYTLLNEVLTPVTGAEFVTALLDVLKQLNIFSAQQLRMQEKK